MCWLPMAFFAAEGVFVVLPAIPVIMLQP